MIVYHRTTFAQKILAGGFRDATGNYLTESTHKGVFLSDIPVSIHEGAHGEDLLSLDLPESLLVQYEWIDPLNSHREFCIPARLINARGSGLRLLNREEAREADFMGEEIATRRAAEQCEHLRMLGLDPMNMPGDYDPAKLRPWT